MAHDSAGQPLRLEVSGDSFAGPNWALPCIPGQPQVRQGTPQVRWRVSHYQGPGWDWASSAPHDLFFSNRLVQTCSHRHRSTRQNGSVQKVCRVLGVELLQHQSLPSHPVSQSDWRKAAQIQGWEIDSPSCWEELRGHIVRGVDTEWRVIAGGFANVLPTNSRSCRGSFSKELGYFKPDALPQAEI